LLGEFILENDLGTRCKMARMVMGLVETIETNNSTPLTTPAAF